MSESSLEFAASVSGMTLARARIRCRAAWNATRKILAPKLVIAILVISTLIAAWLTVQVRELPVAIGLDLKTDPGTPPLLVDGEGRILAEMEVISPQFSPSSTTFHVRGTGKKNPKSKGTAVWYQTVPYIPGTELSYFNNWRRGHLIRDGDLATSVPFEGLVGPITLVFDTHNAAGIVEVETQIGVLQIDLYTEEDGFADVEIPTSSSYRYYGSIPRRNLRDFAFRMTKQTPIQRLYIGALVPHIFFGNKPYPIGAWGRIQTAWEPNWDDNQLNIDDSFSVERGGILTYFLLSASLALTGLIFFPVLSLLFHGCKKLVSLPAPAERRLKKCNLMLAFGIFLLFAAIFSVYLTVYFPAIQATDTRHQWDQVTTDNLRDDHPLLNTLGLKYIRMIWDSWAAVASVQIVAVAGSLAFGFTVLLRAGVPRMPILIALLLACISPRIATHAVTIWKDTPYSALVFLLTIGLSLYFLDDRVRKRFWYWGFLGILLGLIPLYRHNGLAILVAMAILLPFGLASHRKYCLVASIIGISIFAAAKLLLYPLILSETNLVSGVPNFWASNKNLRESGYLLAQDPPLPQSEYEFFSEMHILNPEDKVSLYVTGDFTRYWRERWVERRVAVIDEGNLVRARRRLRSLSLANPLLSFRCIWLEDRSHGAQFLFGRTKGIRLGLFVPLSRENHFGGYAADRLDKILTKIGMSQSILYSQPTICFYSVMLAMLVLVYRKRDIRYTLVYAPVLLNSLALVLVAAGTSDRYHFPLELASGYLVCFAFIPRTPEHD